MSTKYLFNTSKTKSLSIRYGNGMRSMVQIRPRQGVPVPATLTKGLLASYLNLFKGDLKVVTEIPKEVDDANAKENEVTNQIPKEEDQKKDGTQPDDNESSNDSNNSSGESTGDGDGKEEAHVNDPGDQNEPDQNGKDDEEGSKDELDNAGSDAGSGDAQTDETQPTVGSTDEAGEDAGAVQQPTEDSQPDTPVSEGDQNSKDETVLSEKQLKDMKAEEVKAYAKELGLNFEDDITKKALIAVILSKGE